jgi:hypothetical protein
MGIEYTACTVLAPLPHPGMRNSETPLCQLRSQRAAGAAVQRISLFGTADHARALELVLRLAYRKSGAPMSGPLPFKEDFLAYVHRLRSTR